MHTSVYTYFMCIYMEPTHIVGVWMNAYITLYHYERSEMKIKQLDLLWEKNKKLMDLLKKAWNISCDDLELTDDLYACLYAF